MNATVTSRRGRFQDFSAKTREFRRSSRRWPKAAVADPSLLNLVGEIPILK